MCVNARVCGPSPKIVIGSPCMIWFMKMPIDVAVAVADVLALAVHVVRPEDHVVEAEHLVRGAQVELDGELGDAVRVLRARRSCPRVIGS